LIVQHIHDFEVDFFTRKKLFRSQAAASSGLREQHELVGGIHGNLWNEEEGIQGYPALRRSVKARNDASQDDGASVPGGHALSGSDAFSRCALSMIPPPRQTRLSYTTTDCPGVTAHCGSAKSTVQRSLEQSTSVHGASFWR
jgi:hypothetical protein